MYSSVSCLSVCSIQCRLIILVVRACHLVISVFFFFQAEDGIRDLVRSRGLGDVYKRQVLTRPSFLMINCPMYAKPSPTAEHVLLLPDSIWTVSYTHLTLPTSDLV